MPELHSSVTASPIEAKVAFLRKREGYPEHPARVEVIETHMSWVFLADGLAYKLKKPVRHEFLDFTTVQARQRDCAEELRLNRKLAPGVYLDVVPLTQDATGALHLAEAGRVVDWLVKMRRLPSDKMLDAAIGAGTVQEADLRRVARHLADFYGRAAPVPLTPRDYLRRYASDVADNCRALANPATGLPGEMVGEVCAAQQAFLEHHAELLGSRAEGRHVIEAHGDLRPEHICLLPEPVVIDCLEFRREFRLLDTADELAFLALECERLGAPEVGESLTAHCHALLNDTPPAVLRHFYKSYRAGLRAKLAAWHTTDASVRDPARWHERALEYLALARRHGEAAVQ